MCHFRCCPDGREAPSLAVATRRSSNRLLKANGYKSQSIEGHNSQVVARRSSSMAHKAFGSHPLTEAETHIRYLKAHQFYPLVRMKSDPLISDPFLGDLTAGTESCHSKH